MKTLLALLIAVPLGHGIVSAQTGDAQAGKAVWESPNTGCRNCHGGRGEGGLGPDLAGRKLTIAQFSRSVRKPWGIMPAFVDTQMSDKDLADVLAYFDSLPAVAQPGPWRFDVPAGASAGQAAVLSIGCAQCHGPTLNVLRQGAGAVNGDFEWFKKIVYEHTTEQPHHFASLDEPQARLRMGNFSPSRVPPSTLQQIFDYARDLGFRVPIRGQLSAGVPGATGVTYTLNVLNGGLKDKGLTAEDITVALAIPAGATVVATTGSGYEGVRPDEGLKGSAAVWKVARLSPKDTQAFSLTLSNTGTAADAVRGAVRWTKPTVKPGPGDAINVAPAPPAGQTR
jgi:mono/diheme cytochrome c family protein